MWMVVSAEVRTHTLISRPASRVVEAALRHGRNIAACCNPKPNSLELSHDLDHFHSASVMVNPLEPQIRSLTAAGDRSVAQVTILALKARPLSKREDMGT